MSGKFSTTDITTLRRELLERELDCFQIAEVVTAFVASHGYGISREMALNAANLIEQRHRNVESLQRELEISALAM